MLNGVEVIQSQTKASSDRNFYIKLYDIVVIYLIVYINISTQVAQFFRNEV